MPTQQWKANASASRAKCKPSAAEVVAAIESLYKDQVQPIGRILLKRVGERAAAAAFAASGNNSGYAGSSNDLVPCIDPNHLRKVCEKCELLRVQNVDGGEYCAFLVGRRDTFIDATNENDVYPAHLWQELEAFFKGLDTNDLFWPGGRFACAQALATLGPPCLANRSLGELCHIVQLAVSQKKILGYRDGFLVPYDYSLRMLKEQYALHRQPVSAPERTVPSMPHATWEEARSGLRVILASSRDGVVPLPNVKRLFRSQFGMELSETALGYSRLFELLQDERLSDVCILTLQGNSKWAVVPAQQSSASAGAGAGDAATIDRHVPSKPEKAGLRQPPGMLRAPNPAWTPGTSPPYQLFPPTPEPEAPRQGFCGLSTKPVKYEAPLFPAASAWSHEAEPRWQQQAPAMREQLWSHQKYQDPSVNVRDMSTSGGQWRVPQSVAWLNAGSEARTMSTTNTKRPSKGLDRHAFAPPLPIDFPPGLGPEDKAPTLWEPATRQAAAQGAQPGSPWRINVRTDYFIDDGPWDNVEKVSCGSHSTETADSATADTTSDGSDCEAENRVDFLTVPLRQRGAVH